MRFKRDLFRFTALNNGKILSCSEDSIEQNFGRTLKVHSTELAQQMIPLLKMLRFDAAPMESSFESFFLDVPENVCDFEKVLG